MVFCTVISLRWRLFAAVIAALSSVSSLLGAKAKDTTPPETYLDGSLGILFSIQNENFFRLYQRLGSPTRTFAPAFLFAGTTLIEISPHLWVGATASYHEIRLREFHRQTVPAGDTLKVSRAFWEDFVVRVTQGLLRIEWSPYNQQFRTHLIAQIGLAFLRSLWYEGVASPRGQTGFSSGIRFSETAIVPAMKIAAQMVLGFDWLYRSGVLHAFLIEVGYSYIPFTAAFFQYFPAQSPLFSTQKVTLNLGGITILSGIRLRF